MMKTPISNSVNKVKTTAVISFLSLVLSVYATDLETIKERIGNGRGMLRTKQHEEGVSILKNSITELNQLATEQPQNSSIAFQLGMVNFYLENDADAIVAFNKASELDKEDSGPYFFKALIARFGGDYDTAEKEFKTACKLEPNVYRNWYELGVTLSKKDNNKEAISAFEKAVSLEPEQDAKYKLALAHMSIGQHDEAYRLLKEITEAQPSNVDAAFNMGQLCQNLGKNEEALSSFLKVVEENPSDWRAKSKIIQLYQATNQLKERDEHRAQLLKMRTAGNIESLSKEAFYCRDQFSVARNDVMVFEYFELTGDRAIRYSFVVLDPKTNKKEYKISLGSYDSTNAISHELGEIEEGKRLFHLDGYYPKGVHKTFGFYKGEPEYDVVRAEVLKIVSGEQKEISSMTPNQDGNTTIELKQ